MEDLTKIIIMFSFLSVSFFLTSRHYAKLCQKGELNNRQAEKKQNQTIAIIIFIAFIISLALRNI